MRQIGYYKIHFFSMKLFNEWSGPFCCKVGQTPEIIGYYAANLNAGILTVRSANPNALLFAFKNWPLPRSNWTNSTSLYTPVDPSSPPEGIT